MSHRDEHSRTFVGIVTGGTRALLAQSLSFYVRTPVKLFRPARIDYSTLLRQSVPNDHTKSRLRNSNPALLIKAIKKHGWQFVPDKLLPPIIINSLVGSVLYTSYLAALAVIQKPNQPYPTFKQTFYAGGIAGALQAVVATPIDAIALRFDNDILKSETSLWKFGKDQLYKIGPRAAYGGISLNVLKESIGFSMFFSTFEYIKGPVYHGFANWWYSPGYIWRKKRQPSVILYPTFVLFAGCLAGATMQLVTYPLSKFQRLHTMRLQAIDIADTTHKGWKPYINSYQKAFKQMRNQVNTVANGSWFNWLYGGITKKILYSLPSTSIGLLVFEILQMELAPSN